MHCKNNGVNIISLTHWSHHYVFGVTSGSKWYNIHTTAFAECNCTSNVSNPATVYQETTCSLLGQMGIPFLPEIGRMFISNIPVHSSNLQLM